MNIFAYFALHLIGNSQQTDGYSENTKSNNTDDYVYMCYSDVGTLLHIICPNGVIDLKLEMERIAETTNLTYFNEIHARENVSISELQEDVLSGLSIRTINLHSNSLTRINKQAFLSTSNTTVYFDLGSQTQLQNSPPEYDLYYALSTLLYAQSIHISLDPSVDHEIPDNAFRDVFGAQSELRKLIFQGNFAISRIGNNAFYDIPFQTIEPTDLGFHVTSIKTIASKAFDFGITSNDTLIIQLSDKQLTHESFEDNVFSGSQRPLFVDLGNNSIEYIEEKTFKAFLSADQRNQISFIGNNIDCNDITRFTWLLYEKQQLESRVLNVFCNNGTNLWDLEIPEITTTTTTTSNIISTSDTTTTPTTKPSTITITTTPTPSTTPITTPITTPTTTPITTPTTTTTPTTIPTITPTITPTTTPTTNDRHNFIVKFVLTIIFIVLLLILLTLTYKLTKIFRNKHQTPSDKFYFIRRNTDSTQPYVSFV